VGPGGGGRVGMKGKWKKGLRVGILCQTGQGRGDRCGWKKDDD
jgi:hypothetical protein